VAAPQRVEFSERRYAASGPAERLETVSVYIEKFRAKGVDAIVLACTHFLLLLEDFRVAAGGDMLVCDSMEGVTRRVESLLDDNGVKLRGGSSGPEPLLVVTGGGELEPYWERISARFGFHLQREL
jgi:glutamate racemase